MSEDQTKQQKETCSECSHKRYRSSVFCISHYRKDLTHRKANPKFCSNCSIQLGISKKSHLCNKCLHNETCKRIYHSNPTIERARRSQWKKDNRIKINSAQQKREARDPEYKLRRRLRHRVYCALKGGAKRGSAVNDLGCSIADLKSRLESLFKPGMTWDNYGRKVGVMCWEIDHVKPLSKFDLSDPGELKKACNYTNLQPLWAIDNQRKGNKYV